MLSTNYCYLLLCWMRRNTHFFCSITVSHIILLHFIIFLSLISKLILILYDEIQIYKLSRTWVAIMCKFNTCKDISGSLDEALIQYRQLSWTNMGPWNVFLIKIFLSVCGKLQNMSWFFTAPLNIVFFPLPVESEWPHISYLGYRTWWKWIVFQAWTSGDLLAYIYFLGNLLLSCELS